MNEIKQVSYPKDKYNSDRYAFYPFPVSYQFHSTVVQKQRKIYFFQLRGKKCSSIVKIIESANRKGRRERILTAVYALERKYKQTRFIVCFYGFTLIEIFSYAENSVVSLLSFVNKKLFSP